MVKLLEKDNRKNTLVNAVIFLLGAWVIAWLRLRNIDIMKGPYVFPDQLGYFTHAAILNGLPWYQTTDSWYSYGISIVIAMVMRITHNMASIYKLLIYVNVLLGELGYILGCIFVKQISPKINYAYAFVISTVASCCTAYVFQAQVVWAETYVYTIFMLVLVLAAWYAKKPGLLRVFFLTVSVCILFVVHNRTIVVIPALLGYIFFTMFADRKVLARILHLGLILMMVLGTYKANSVAKIWFQDREGVVSIEAMSEQEWIEANSTVVCTTAVTRDVRPDIDGFDFFGEEFQGIPVHDLYEKNDENNLSGRLFNVLLVFNDSKAFWGMVKSFIGSFWYLMSATAGLAAFGIIFLLKKMFAGLKKGASCETKLKSCFFVFVILCVGATMAETGYNAMWYPEYTYSTDGAVYWEMLFYGRYVELLTMPFIILGFLDILEVISKKSMILECVAAVVIHVGAAILVYVESVNLTEPMLNLVCVPGIHSMLSHGIEVACIVPVIFSIIMYTVLKLAQNRAAFIEMAVQFGIAFVLLGFFYINLKPVEVYNNDAQLAINGYNEIAEVLHNNTDVKVIIDSNCVLRDRYYKVRTQAIDNEIAYGSKFYNEEDRDFIFLTDENNVDLFMSEHVDEKLSLLWYGNYPMIIKGDSLIERLTLEGYEMR